MMKIKNMLMLLSMILFLLLIGCSARTDDQNPTSPDYSCKVDSDCTHTCGAKCANIEWAKTYDDPCVNIRAYDCTCVNDQCYSDGNPSN